MNEIQEQYQVSEVERVDIEMWTDGACSGNPGTGGWCAILKSGQYEKTIQGRNKGTTNNQMELQAVLEGIRIIKRPAQIRVHTDSRLVIGWMRDSWRRKDIECAKLSAEIDRIIEQGQHKVEWLEVKGHSGDRHNERCDSIAQHEARLAKIELAHSQQSMELALIYLTHLTKGDSWTD